MLKVIQSWDDGVVDDIRLVDICRKHSAKASFNLNPGLHETIRGHGWFYGDKEVLRLARSELTSVYEGFEIANHTATHPDLCRLSPDEFDDEINDSRKKLQDWFGQPVDGFCYPYGNATQESQLFIEACGHRFARDASGLGKIFPAPAFSLVKPQCYFNDPDFWQKYEEAQSSSGYFFFWGHSYELIADEMWEALDHNIERISQDADAEWMTLSEAVSLSG